MSNINKIKSRLLSDKLHRHFDVMVKLYCSEMSDSDTNTFADLLVKQLNGSYRIAKLENNINWRDISKVGNPTDGNKSYLVTDGTDISTSDIIGSTRFKGDGNPIFTFKGWVGDENTYEENSCCSGERVFDMIPTHWCPTDELNLPEK